LSDLECTPCPETSPISLIGFTAELRSAPWFAVYVKHRHEKCVAASLQGQGYEAFLPTYLKIGQSSKRSELPLFPGYVFCRFAAQKMLPILSTPGVFSIVGSALAPASIPDGEIAGIKRLLASGLTPRPWSYVACGQQVCIKSGPLRGLEGLVVDDTHQKWLIVSVHLLQRSVAVKIERNHVEVSPSASFRNCIHADGKCVQLFF